MGETGKIRYEGKPTADSVLGRRICVPPRDLSCRYDCSRAQVGGS